MVVNNIKYNPSIHLIIIIFSCAIVKVNVPMCCTVQIYGNAAIDPSHEICTLLTARAHLTGKMREHYSIKYGKWLCEADAIMRLLSACFDGVCQLRVCTYRPFRKYHCASADC